MSDGKKSGKNESAVNWSEITKSLENWRKKTLANPDKDDTAMTTIAEEYDEGPGKPWAILVST
ncbi:MAG: hypothetical protein FWB82_02000, partial [Treponema sp.]|nr:hypothetical protein [Treponema sp.]